MPSDDMDRVTGGEGYDASAAEIGQLRREIREALAYSREHGAVPAAPFMKAATLSRSAFMWLVQRMRPQELDLLEKHSGRSVLGDAKKAADDRSVDRDR